MVIEEEPPFDPKVFLAKIGEGCTIGKYGKYRTIFSQGDFAEAVFYIQKGKVKITVVSAQGKEAVIAMLGGMNSAAKVVLPDSPGAWRQPR